MLIPTVSQCRDGRTACKHGHSLLPQGLRACVMVIPVTCAKTTEPIKMPVGVQTGVGHDLYGDPDLPNGKWPF